MNEYTEVSREIGWDDVIEKGWPGLCSAARTVSIPSRVTKLERARFQGSAKLPPCNMAILTITVDGGEKGASIVTHRLYLHTKNRRPALLFL